MVVLGEGTEKEGKILLDCGGFQGPGSKEKNSYLPPSINPMELDYIFITHSHYDHVGRLPILVKRGFGTKSGSRIICTPVVRDIVLIVLEDSLKLQEEAYEETGDSDMLFDRTDLENVKKLFDIGGSGSSDSGYIVGDVNYPEWTEKKGRLKVKFVRSEHIIGSVSIWIKEPISLLYTGDLGGGRSLLHSEVKTPEVGKSFGFVDYLMIESTYGNREMDDVRDVTKLSDIIDYTKRMGGKLLIPVFAVDRPEEILYLLKSIGCQEKVYLDTPMGSDVLDLYANNKYLLSEIRERFQNSGGELKGMGTKDKIDYVDKEFKKIFRPDNFERIGSMNSSELLANRNESCIILASSGMLEGGRVIGHLKGILEDEKSTILFTGYQAFGTLGREILDGAKEVTLKKKIIMRREGLEGEKGIDIVNFVPERVNIKCLIKKIDGLSAHADKKMLLNYIDGFTILPNRIFVVHGETDSSSELATSIESKFRIRSTVNRYNTKYELIPGQIIEKTIIKDIANINKLIELGLLKFEDYAGKKYAPFGGWVRDDGDNYMLISQEDFQKNLNELRNSVFDLQRRQEMIQDERDKEEGQDKTGGGGGEDKDIKTNGVSDFDSEKFVSILVDYFNEGLISKGLVRVLITSCRMGSADYINTLEKRIKGNSIITTDSERRIKGVKELNDEDKIKIANYLEELLRKAGSIDIRILKSCLEKVIQQIKDK